MKINVWLVWMDTGTDPQTELVIIETIWLVKLTPKSPIDVWLVMMINSSITWTNVKMSPMFQDVSSIKPILMLVKFVKLESFWMEIFVHLWEELQLLTVFTILQTPLVSSVMTLLLWMETLVKLEPLTTVWFILPPLSVKSVKTPITSMLPMSVLNTQMTWIVTSLIKMPMLVSLVMWTST